MQVFANYNDIAFEIEPLRNNVYFESGKEKYIYDYICMLFFDSIVLRKLYDYPCCLSW